MTRFSFQIAAFALGCILIGTLIPNAAKQSVLSPFPAWLHADKVGHFFGFALFAGALVATGRVRPWMAVSVALGLGSLTELLQNFADGRTPLLSDVVIDTAGACLGAMVCLWWSRGRSKPSPA